LLAWLSVASPKLRFTASPSLTFHDHLCQSFSQGWATSADTPDPWRCPRCTHAEFYPTLPFPVAGGVELAKTLMNRVLNDQSNFVTKMPTIAEVLAARAAARDAGIELQPLTMLPKALAAAVLAAEEEASAPMELAVGS
jgi:hypothetical protein